MKLSKAQVAALTALSSWDFTYFERKAKTTPQRLGLMRTMQSLEQRQLVYSDDGGASWGITMLGQQEIFARVIDATSQSLIY